MRYLKVIAVSILALSLTGCTLIFQKGRRSDVERINDLTEQVEALNAALSKLSAVKDLLAERLKQEITDKEVRLDMRDKGLVITFVADVLFDSGKAQIKPEAKPTLDKVAVVLLENVSEYDIGIEGHTDTQPIKYSGWKSNWELSSARALSVLHYLVEEKAIAPNRISAIGYGEYHPVASNDTPNGMQLNRRVEIVILPKLTKVREAQEMGRTETQMSEASVLKEPVENLK